MILSDFQTLLQQSLMSGFKEFETLDFQVQVLLANNSQSTIVANSPEVATASTKN